MNNTERGLKKIVIGAIFLLIVFLIILAFYMHSKGGPSCVDGKQNQGEMDIDCGGIYCESCESGINEETTKDLVFGATEIVHDVDNKYDIIKEIKNPNEKIGAKRIDFKVILFGTTKKIVKEFNITNEYILPQEDKYVIATGIELDAFPVDSSVEVANIEWEESFDSVDPRLVVLNKNFEKESGGSAFFAKVNGTLINKSDADFEVVRVKVVIRDEKGVFLATSYQTMNTLRSGERRDFIIPFYHSFSESIGSLEVYPETNIYDEDNYINSQHYIKNRSSEEELYQ